MRTLVAVALIGFGCGTKDERPPKPIAPVTTPTPADASTTPSVSGSMVDLPKLGLGIAVDGSIDLDIDDGYWLVVQGESGLSITRTKPQTMAEVKTTDEYICTPQNLVESTLPDGWAYTFTCPALDPKVHGVEYFVHVQRTIAGKPIHCSFKGGRKETVQAALAACKTLRPTT